ncbi:hypothetical protein [uncultured Maricaulis sp.]|uniref:hypothetical protein n=1 Tax=uncultured Maricaulis sp. TaxID=174710 RepID=UPI0030D77E6D|tara:strand:- start:9616 stop:10284 length:669 start_codon:yes stop_codon:yes gene_type:complete
MLDISELIAAVQEAVSEAAEQVHQKNLELLDNYFEPSDIDPNDRDLNREKHAAHHDEPDRRQPRFPLASFAQSLRRAPPAESVAAAAAAAASGIPPGREPPGNDRKRDDDNPRGPIQPKMVVVRYPIATENGPTTHDVWVPLISLLPQSQLELKELRLTLKVEPTEGGKGLRLAFPGRRTWFSPARDDYGQVEIVIEGTQTPVGRTELIEGYNKVLRAQIPG